MNLNDYAKQVHAANQKWWQDPATGLPIKRNKGELLALIHSEISECFDGESANLMDDKLPHRKMGEVELIDAQIRIFDYAAGFSHDLNRAGILFGVSEFIDLNHLSKCINVPGEVISKLRKNGVSVIHSEISKVLEHERKGRLSEAESGLFLCLMHISIYANIKGYDLQGAFDDKMTFNSVRKDHTHEARLIAGGKQF